MKRAIYAFLVLALALGLVPMPARAAGLGDGALCLPLPSAIVLDDCLPYGPYGYLQHMAELGLTIPEQPLPASSPDINLAHVPYAYAQVKTRGAPVFASAVDAAAGKPVKRNMQPGFDYVSYTQQDEIGGKKVYMTAIGEWMRGGDLSVVRSTITFMGLQFSATPSRKFGWTLQAKQSYQAPSANAPLAERTFVRWNVIRVYDIQQAEGVTWYLVGPDTWIESKDTALVYPTATAPAGVENGRWIEVNLAEQTLSVYNNNQLVYATLLSSGANNFWTRPGLFHITQKLDTTPMSGAFEVDRSDYYYLADVPWTMYFDEARALHGAYWHTKFGTKQSHGCVNLSPGDAHWLYDWAVLGDWVYVWDPSGQTPTDPAKYGQGGA